jgi:hypothetical protein
MKYMDKIFFKTMNFENLLNDIRELDKAPSDFGLFCKKYRSEVVQRCGHLKNFDVERELREKWRQTSKEEKAEFQKEADLKLKLVVKNRNFQVSKFIQSYVSNNTYENPVLKRIRLEICETDRQIRNLDTNLDADISSIMYIMEETKDFEVDASFLAKYIDNAQKNGDIHILDHPDDVQYYTHEEKCFLRKDIKNSLFSEREVSTEKHIMIRNDMIEDLAMWYKERMKLIRLLEEKKKKLLETLFVEKKRLRENIRE